MIRNWLLIAIVAAVAAIAIYMFAGSLDASRPGQPAPHALDQSQ